MKVRVRRQCRLPGVMPAMGVLLVLFAMHLPAASAFTVRAVSDVRLSTNGGPERLASEDSGEINALAVSLPLIDLESVGTSSRAAATVQGTARVGRLSLFSSYVAESFGAGGLGAGVGLDRTTLSWTDAVTFTHPTLPDGSPVELLARLQLTGPFTATRVGNAIPNGLARATASGGFRLQIEERVGSLVDRVVEELFSVRVGDTVPLAGSLHAAIGGDAIAGGMSSVTADFSSTAVLNLLPVTPGLALVSASGVNYVPLPPALGLFAAALGVAGLCRRRA